MGNYKKVKMSYPHIGKEHPSQSIMESKKESLIK